MTDQPTSPQTLLLVFRKESPDLFHLLNETGLPISPTSPLITSQTQGKTLVVAPLLLVAVTEAMRANQDVFGGFEYSMSWTANDFRHFYVILEKRPPPKKKGDDNNNNNEPSPWDQPDDNNQSSGDNQNSSLPWDDSNNNNNNDTTKNNDNNNTSNNDTWGSPTNNNNTWGSSAPPGSPVRDTSSEFKNHEWPAGLVNANNPSGSGGGRGRSASGATSDWDVRDWARSPSEVGTATPAASSKAPVSSNW